MLSFPFPPRLCIYSPSTRVAAIKTKRQPRLSAIHSSLQEEEKREEENGEEKWEREMGRIFFPPLSLCQGSNSGSSESV